MVKDTHTHSLTCCSGLLHFESSHILSCPHPHCERAGLGNTGLSPLILNHLRGTSCFLSAMFSLASSAFFPQLPAETHLTSVGQGTMELIPSTTLTDCSKLGQVLAFNSAFEWTFSDLCGLFLDARTTTSAYVPFNLNLRLVAMETPTNVPLVGNHDLAYCKLYFLISLQSRRQYIITHKPCVLA